LPRLRDRRTRRPNVRISRVFPAFLRILAGRMRASVRGGKPFASLLTGDPAEGPATLPLPVRQGPMVPGTTLLLASAVCRAAPGMALAHDPVSPVTRPNGFRPAQPPKLS
jgi:hypothetical protein